MPRGNRRDRTADKAYLARLADILTDARLPSQVAISRAVGVDQPLVSNARNGNLEWVTDRVRRLYDYTESELARMEEAGRSAPITPAGTSGSGTAGDAIERCRRYVEDGYDAGALAEQVDLLRRVQNAARV